MLNDYAGPYFWCVFLGGGGGGVGALCCLCDVFVDNLIFDQPPRQSDMVLSVLPD